MPLSAACRLSPAALEEGPNIFRLSVKDAAGNGGSDGVFVLRDTTAPVANVIYPRDGACLSNLTPNLLVLWRDPEPGGGPIVSRSVDIPGGEKVADQDFELPLPGFIAPLGSGFDLRTPVIEIDEPKSVTPVTLNRFLDVTADFAVTGTLAHHQIDLLESNHVLRAKVDDHVGNRGSFDQSNFTLDITSPKRFVSHTPPGDIVTTRNVLLVIDYYDPPSKVDGSMCNVNLETLKATLTEHLLGAQETDQEYFSLSDFHPASPGPSKTVLSYLVPDGTYTLDAEIYDYAGNRSGSPVDTFTVDTEPPDFKIVPDIKTRGLRDEVTNIYDEVEKIGHALTNRSPEFVGLYQLGYFPPPYVFGGPTTRGFDFPQAPKVPAGVDTGTVQVKVDGSLISEVKSEPIDANPSKDPGLFRATLSMNQKSALGEGTHRITASMSDFAGHARSAQMDFIIDKQPPQIVSITFNHRTLRDYLGDPAQESAHFDRDYFVEADVVVHDAVNQGFGGLHIDTPPLPDECAGFGDFLDGRYALASGYVDFNWWQFVGSNPNERLTTSPPINLLPNRSNLDVTYESRLIENIGTSTSCLSGTWKLTATDGAGNSITALALPFEGGSDSAVNVSLGSGLDLVLAGSWAPDWPNLTTIRSLQMDVAESLVSGNPFTSGAWAFGGAFQMNSQVTGLHPIYLRSLPYLPQTSTIQPLLVARVEGGKLQIVDALLRGWTGGVERPVWIQGIKQPGTYILLNPNSALRVVVGEFFHSGTVFVRAKNAADGYGEIFESRVLSNGAYALALKYITDRETVIEFVDGSGNVIQTMNIGGSAPAGVTNLGSQDYVAPSISVIRPMDGDHFDATKSCEIMEVGASDIGTGMDRVWAELSRVDTEGNVHLQEVDFTEPGVSDPSLQPPGFRFSTCASLPRSVRSAHTLRGYAKDRRGNTTKTGPVHLGVTGIEALSRIQNESAEPGHRHLTDPQLVDSISALGTLDPAGMGDQDWLAAIHALSAIGRNLALPEDLRVQAWALDTDLIAARPDLVETYLNKPGKVLHWNPVDFNPSVWDPGTGQLAPELPLTVGWVLPRIAPGASGQLQYCSSGIRPDPVQGVLTLLYTMISRSALPKSQSVLEPSWGAAYIGGDYASVALQALGAEETFVFDEASATEDAPLLFYQQIDLPSGVMLGSNSTLLSVPAPTHFRYIFANATDDQGKLIGHAGNIFDNMNLVEIDPIEKRILILADRLLGTGGEGGEGLSLEYLNLVPSGIAFNQLEIKLEAGPNIQVNLYDSMTTGAQALTYSVDLVPILNTLHSSGGANVGVEMAERLRKFFDDLAFEWELPYELPKNGSISSARFRLSGISITPVEGEFLVKLVLDKVSVGALTPLAGEGAKVVEKEKVELSVPVRLRSLSGKLSEALETGSAQISPDDPFTAVLPEIEVKWYPSWSWVEKLYKEGLRVLDNIIREFVLNTFLPVGLQELAETQGSAIVKAILQSVVFPMRKTLPTWQDFVPTVLNDQDQFAVDLVGHRIDQGGLTLYCLDNCPIRILRPPTPPCKIP